MSSQRDDESVVAKYDRYEPSATGQLNEEEDDDEDDDLLLPEIDYLGARWPSAGSISITGRQVASAVGHRSLLPPSLLLMFLPLLSVYLPRADLRLPVFADSR